MPRYHFVVCEADHARDDPDGVQSHPLLFGSRISTFLFSLKLVGRWRTRSVRCDQWQSESAVARCRCKPLAGRPGYHSTSAASCRYLQCGCTIERKPAKQDRARQSRPSTLRSLLCWTLPISFVCSPPGTAAAHPIGSTNGRVIPVTAKVGASHSDNFFTNVGE